MSEDGRAARAVAAAHRTNRRPGIVDALRAARDVLPGEPLGLPGDHVSEVVARYLAERGNDETATKELGLAAVQVWQALSTAVGRGAGPVEATVMFTDIVGFSSWVLESGDGAGLELLRAVAGVVEPAITRCRGRVVKRLGDGHMAVFASADEAVQAGLDTQQGMSEVVVEGHRPALRIGLHHGQPRKMGSDYLGTDVNIAARVCEAAGPAELLVSAPVLAAIDGSGLEVTRKRFFRAKGVPRGLEVYSLARA